MRDRSYIDAQIVLDTRGLCAGDRIMLGIDPNCVRRRIKRVLDSTRAELETFVRPSRGWARHMRRVKAGHA